MGTKTKISVTVRSDLLSEIDRACAHGGRSTVVEEALSLWLRRRKQAALDRAIESYYRGLTASDQGEDEDWARRVGDDAVRQWGR
jgi:metal-responsive CopG/Arc/MetJ family transcriptional regulator